MLNREWRARQRVDPQAPCAGPTRKRVAAAAVFTGEDGSDEAPPLKRPGPAEQRCETPEEALEKELEALEKKKKLLMLKERVRIARREVALLEEKMRGEERMEE